MDKKCFVVLKQITYVQEVKIFAKRKQDAINLVASGEGELGNLYADRPLDPINWMAREIPVELPAVK